MQGKVARTVWLTTDRPTESVTLFAFQLCIPAATATRMAAAAAWSPSLLFQLLKQRQTLIYLDHNTRDIELNSTACRPNDQSLLLSAAVVVVGFRFL
jgi:hypothetical protein